MASIADIVSGNVCYLRHFFIGSKEIKKIVTMRLFLAHLTYH